VLAERLSKFTSFIPEPGPQRVYALSLLINSLGFGLVMASSVLYFTRVVHLTAGEVGIGLTIAGLVGLVAGIPAGHLADRHGPRAVFRIAVLVEFLATSCYLFIHSFAIFVMVSTIDVLAFNASQSADGALIRRVGGDGEDATAFRSATRVIMNAGVALGGLGCAVAVQIDTPDAYRILMIGNALTFLAAWAVCGILPRYEPLPRPEAGPRWGVIADRAFVGYAVYNAAMSLQYFVILLPLPLWVVSHTHAPRWSVGMYMLVNTFIVILLQVRVSRKVHSIRQGGIALRRAGIIFLLSCSAIGLAAGLPGWAALVLLVSAVAVHSVGETYHAAASFALDFGLAPAHAQGQYQGLSGLSTGAAATAAPVTLIGLCLRFGAAGWVGAGVFFAMLSLLGPAIAGWGERTRPQASQPSGTTQMAPR
jgi:hypothetical protein